MTLHFDGLGVESQISIDDVSNTPECRMEDCNFIPPELLELEQVDMTNEDMDPLEWTARKFIPIPKKYYWEAEDVNSSQLPNRLILWHRSVAAMGSIVRFTDRIGTSLAGFFGFTSSPFDYVTSSMTEADWKLARRIAEQKQRVTEQEAETFQNASD